jgi:hypothetical protein
VPFAADVVGQGSHKRQRRDEMGVEAARLMSILGSLRPAGGQVPARLSSSGVP